MLCGGMSVDIPTAIPVTPLRMRLGNLEGRNSGSLSVPSKFGFQSVVPWPSSLNINFVYALSFASVYLMAANDFGSSYEPQFPWPMINGYRYEKSCAILTIAS